ncbi:ABC transporter ATP-binding protein [Azomonas macrocytogenes]|uniref:NitT/TauT family transport system ATP-binding protein n=1 Tax=Azomonas macrocytogenes TaxID=69962 RepID=A0A839T4Y9_AZOMA|nr:ABC transporter ATP-binding protein [Azomonas macrocytogenes]MBB3102773.1 NitT/TauT family transport system ATP-binding protein [Azomonas macrocytogenes]
MTSEREIQFRNVSVRYAGAPNDGWVVRNVSLDLGRGEFVSLIGPSGCGKTTLLKLAAGMSTPTQGSVTLGSQPITAPGPERGVVFQEYGVFPWLSVRGNIEFGLTLAANRRDAAERAVIVDKYLALMGLGDFRDALPNTLSGGMRQRVALARAYAVNPEFLLMDEPFGALDAQTRLVMHDLLLDLQRQEEKSVLLITHSVDEALYLSSKIVLVSARPARITEIIEVPFAYPRDESVRATSEFVRLHAHLRARVMAEYAQQQREDIANTLHPENR